MNSTTWPLEHPWPSKRPNPNIDLVFALFFDSDKIFRKTKKKKFIFSRRIHLWTNFYPPLNFFWNFLIFLFEKKAKLIFLILIFSRKFHQNILPESSTIEKNVLGLLKGQGRSRGTKIEMLQGLILKEVLFYQSMTLW